MDRLIARLDAQARLDKPAHRWTIVASYLALLALVAALVIVHQDTKWIAAALGGNLLPSPAA